MGLVLGLFRYMHPCAFPRDLPWQGAVCGYDMSCHHVLCQLCFLAYFTINAALLGSCVQWLGRALQPATSAQGTWVA